MGFNTAIVILNDELNEIENDTRFGLKVAEAIRQMAGTAYGKTVRIGHYSSHVVSSAHADLHQVIEVHRNIGTVMKQPKRKSSPYKVAKDDACPDCGMQDSVSLQFGIGPMPKGRTQIIWTSNDLPKQCKGCSQKLVDGKCYTPGCKKGERDRKKEKS